MQPSNMMSAMHEYQTPHFGHTSGSSMPSYPTSLSQRQGIMTGLDALAAGSQYALQQMQSQESQPPAAMKQQNIDRTAEESPVRVQKQSKTSHRDRSSDEPVRKRISRACDQCNQLRTKCDGSQPCTHCTEFGLGCEYARQRKKRGKASRKDLAAQQAAPDAGNTEEAQASPGSTNGTTTENQGIKELYTKHVSIGKKRRRSSSHALVESAKIRRSNSVTSKQLYNTHSNLEQSARTASTGSIDPQDPMSVHQAADGSNRQMAAGDYNGELGLPPVRLSAGSTTEQRLPFSMSDFGSIDDYHRTVLQRSASVNGNNLLHGSASLQSYPHNTGMHQYPQQSYNVPSPQSQTGGAMATFRMGESPISAGFLGVSPNAGSPSWLNLPSPSAYANLPHPSVTQSLKYPALRPIIPRIASIIPVPLACDLLELYFASSSSAFIQPASPYILGFVLRKRSVLRQHDPRPCSQALLASMLWVSAQSSESSFLTSPPSQRAKICHQLLELTISLLNPLVHTSTNLPSSYGTHSVINGVALGGFGVANLSAGHDNEGGSTGATAALDDVITYINLATVVSASEYKAASLRWWNAAWSLAREMKLGKELPATPQGGQNESEAVSNSDQPKSSTNNHPNMPQPGVVSEEEREERRRIWWLLYTVDRHLALCYNRPLFLLDVECDGLLQPENDTLWQLPEYFPPENYEQSLYFRRRGPCFECTGHSIFGYFLPLMTILGEIVDLNHAKNHPRFGVRFRHGHEWEDQAAEISQQLDAYGRSLKEFEARISPSDASCEKNTATGVENLEIHSPHESTSTSATRMTEAVLQTKIVLAYGTHLMHTLHILLNGKWDPISLLDDNDLWISSQSFISATGHAVAAAEAISDILEYDPDLSFMPFFFGIYLLQGSFLLLLIADKLQGEASPSVVRACETIVRAHEVCCVTLNTEYQRNFRKVMRSALAQVKGRMPEDFGEQQQRRREVLALYRWTGDGTGLAL